MSEFVLVPVEPTQKMLEMAAFNLCNEFGVEFVQANEAFARAVYREFLYFAPEAHKQSGQKQVADPENLQFTSACELDGPKHQEYVKGWEAAMDAVRASVDNAKPVAYGITYNEKSGYIASLCFNKRIAEDQCNVLGGHIVPLYAAQPSAQNHEIGEVVVTKTEDGQIVAVTRQDEEGRILSVIAESGQEQSSKETSTNHDLLSVAREMLDARCRVIETETMARWQGVIERASKPEAKPDILEYDGNLRSQNQPAIERTEANLQQELAHTREGFQREWRYIVIKRKKILEYALGDEATAKKIEKSILNQTPDEALVECVVIESDWPEYEAVWGRIEKRCTGLRKPEESTEPRITQAHLDSLKNAEDKLKKAQERRKEIEQRLGIKPDDPGESE